MSKSVYTKILFFAFIFITFFICFYKLGSFYLENWDEGFYAQATKEMLAAKDFLIPHWNGLIYLDKPPLNFWLNSVFSSVLGLSEFSVRLTSALSGFAVILIVAFYAYKNWGALSAILAFSTIALNNLFIWRSRTGNLDAL